MPKNIAPVLGNSLAPLGLKQPGGIFMPAIKQYSRNKGVINNLY